MRYSRNWEQNTMLEKGRVCMKDREELLKEIALMLERQDMLSKLTENQCLDEYGYSETHCIDYIGRLELPNVTKVAEHMGMTRGAISKMTKKLLAKGLIEKYTLETNKKEVYFKLTDQGRLLFDEHAKRHQRWEKQRYGISGALFRRGCEDGEPFYDGVQRLSGRADRDDYRDAGRRMILCNRNEVSCYTKKESCRQDSHVLLLYEM